MPSCYWWILDKHCSSVTHWNLCTTNEFPCCVWFIFSATAKPGQKSYRVNPASNKQILILKENIWATERWRGIFPVQWLMHEVMQIIFFVFLPGKRQKACEAPHSRCRLFVTLIALCDWTNCHSDLYNWEPSSLTLVSPSQLYVSTSLSNRNSKFVSLGKVKHAQNVFSFNSLFDQMCCSNCFWWCIMAGTLN